MSVLQIFRGDEFLEEVVLSRAVMGLGRHPQNDIVLDDRSLSRFHARVERRGDRFVVVDCGAQNGVHLNGERVVGESDLAPGDRITLGRYIAVFDSSGRVEPAPKYDLNRPLKSGTPRSTSLDADLEALEVDVDINLDDDNDQTKRAKHKELLEDDFDKTAKKKPEPTLVLLFNGMEVSRHPVSQGGLTIGRSKQCDVVISLLGLSRKHAQIRRVKDAVSVEDLGSQNGTWVNNQRIQGQRRLKHGDLLNFYDYAVLFLEDGDVDVGFPGGTFPQPGDTDAAAADELESRETNRSAPVPGSKARPPTARSPVPIADSAHSSSPAPSRPASARHNGHGRAAAGGAGVDMASASELVDLGEGSFLGEEFDHEANAKKQQVSSSLLDEEALDDIGLDDDEVIGNKTNATDIVKDIGLDSAFKNEDLDAGGFDGMSGTEGDQEKFDDRTSSSIRSGGRAWATDDEVLRALSNSPDSVMATLEVQLGGKPYTQMPLSQTVTRVGTDARCELSLPKSSGLMAWHLTLLHMGGTVVLYRAARAGRIQLAETDVDMAIAKDGDMLDLGKVKLKIRLK